MKHFSSNTHGFTLLEIIIAIAILSIIAVSFLNMFLFGATELYAGNKSSSAQFGAQSSIEFIIANPIYQPGLLEIQTFTVDFPVPITVNGVNIEQEQPFVDSRGSSKSIVFTTFTPKGVILNKSTVNLSIGSSFQLYSDVPDGYLTSDLLFTLSRSNGSEYVLVSASGLITGLKHTPSPVTVLVRTPDLKYTASCSVIVE